MKLEEARVIGKIGPHYNDVDVEFWRGLSQGKLKIQRCTRCRKWIWGASWRCGDCGSWDLEWEAIALEGRVFSWIRTHQAFAPEMLSQIPYVTLLVELPQAGSKRLMGMLVGSEAGLKIGARVEGVIQPASDLTTGYPVLRWRLCS